MSPNTDAMLAEAHPLILDRCSQSATLAQMNQPTPGLLKVLTSREVLALSFGAMIGWSWVLLSGQWVSQAGSLGAALAFALGGVIVLLIGLLYAELAAAMPKVGGEHVYTLRALGVTPSFVCTFALLVAYLGVCMFESTVLPVALQYLFPQLTGPVLWTLAGYEVDLVSVLIGVGATIFMTVVNLFGVRVAAIVQTLITLGIALAALLLVTGAIKAGSITHMAPFFSPQMGGFLMVLVIVPVMLVGFDVIPQSAEEIDLPPSRIGQVLVFSVGLAILFYVVILVSVSVAPGREGGFMATATSASHLWGSDKAGALIVLGGIAGILSSWNAFILGGSRVIYALSESGMLPAVLSRLHPRFRTPHVAIILIGALSCVSPWLGRAVLNWLVNVGSFSLIIAYLMVSVAFLALRRNEPDMPRPFRVRFGTPIAWTCLISFSILFFLFLPPSPSALAWPAEWAILLIWLVVGLSTYFYQRKSMHA